ncbi:MAG: CPBP family glutamic-type intramembrane protease [Thermoanaerobaculia bacterium]
MTDTWSTGMNGTTSPAGNRANWVELSAMTALVLSYEWIWDGAFRGHGVLVLFLFLAIAVSGHLRRGETAREIGFRLDNFWSSARFVFSFAVPAALVIILIGWLTGLMHPRPIGHLIPRLAFLPLWGIGQQYALLGFYYRRFDDVLPGVPLPILVTAGLFAFFHLPNPFLTVATFAAGVLACVFYRKAPNLYVIGLAHGFLAAVLESSLHGLTTVGMKVGLRALG